MRRKEKNEGFSLIETLVAMGIVVILSGIVLAYNHSSDQRIVLFTEQAKVAGVLNRAKALALERYKGNNVSYCAFGVVFEASGSYSIVAVPAPASAAVPCIAGGSLPASSDAIDSYTLDNRVSFTSLPPTGGIFFEAPYLNTIQSGTIVLEVKNASPAAEASVEVTSGGSITSM